jgi:hypothetical protein
MDFMAELAAAMIALNHDLTVPEFAAALRLLKTTTIGVVDACS